MQFCKKTFFAVAFMIVFSVSTEVCAVEAVTSPELKQVKESIIFLYGAGSSPCSNPKETPIGTGFVVGLALKDKPERLFKYVITNAHVLTNQKTIVLRLNRSDSTGTVCVDADLSKAIYPKDKSIDLVAIPIADIPHTDPTVFDYSYVLGTAQLAQAEIEEGTEVVAIGFLNPYAGIAKNFPVMRFGKIALLTDEKWMTTDGTNFQKGHLVEVYNVGGSSGSPVVLQPSQVRVNRQGVIQKRRIAPYIIGVVKGHPNSPAQTIQVKDGIAQKVQDQFAMVPAGVAIVEPGDSLRTLLEQIAKDLETAGHPVILGNPF